VPYANVPPALTGRMDRCVKRVMSGDTSLEKGQAIAICYTSIMKKRSKAQYKARVESYTRTVNGKQITVSGYDATSKYAKKKAPKSGKAGKAKVDKTLSPDTVEKIGIDAGDVSNINNLLKAGATSSEVANELVRKGYAERDSEGRLLLTPDARSMVNAIKGGDADAAARAFSNIREKPKKQAEAEAKKKAKEAERSAKRAEREGARAQRKADADKRHAEAASRRAEADKRRSERDQERRAKRATKSDTDGGSDHSTSVAGGFIPIAAHKGLQNDTPTMRVFKQANGRLRWVGYSTNSYMDVDKECVTYKGLQSAVRRADEEGYYGVLRMWHIGDVALSDDVWHTARATDGWNLGDADFVALHGRIMIHSGTFYDDAVGAAIGRHVDKFALSVGMTRPPGEPINGEYNDVKIFDISLLPAAAAANRLTGLGVFGG
jgi:hypothetical protein